MDAAKLIFIIHFNYLFGVSFHISQFLSTWMQHHDVISKLIVSLAGFNKNVSNTTAGIHFGTVEGKYDKNMQINLK